MVQGEYSLTSHLPVPKQPTAVMGENPDILQAGVKIQNLYRTATKLPSGLVKGTDFGSIP